MEEKELTPMQSLKLIESTIEQSRQDMTAHAGKQMLWWGLIVVATSLIVHTLTHFTGHARWNFLWYVMTIIGFAGGYLIDKRAPTQPTGFIARAVGAIWIAFAIFAVLASAIELILWSQELALRSHLVPVAPLLILLMGMAATTTCMILKQKALAAVEAIVSLSLFIFILIPQQFDFPVFAFLAIFALIIPGLYMTRNHGRK